MVVYQLLQNIIVVVVRIVSQAGLRINDRCNWTSMYEFTATDESNGISCLITSSGLYL